MGMLHRAVCLLRLTDKLFRAFGTGNGDLTFSPGDTHRLVASGATEILVLSVLDTVQQHQKTAIFPIASIGIPGQRPEYRHKH